MLSSWARLFIIVNCLILLIAFLAKSTLDLQDRYVSYRTESTARQIAENIRLQIETHLRVLQTLAEVEQRAETAPSSGGMRLTEAIVKHYPGIYAVNWLDASGVIRRVYPIERNELALGKNLLEVPTVSDVIILSRERKIPVMVPRVKTYQGIEGATLYIPVFRDGEIIGWVNSVLDIQGWLTRQLKSKGEPGLSVRLAWDDELNSTYEFGPERVSDTADGVQLEILNQTLKISVRLEDLRNMDQRRWIDWTMTAASLFLALLFLILITGLTRSVRDLTMANQRLSLKNALVSSLTHDLGNPLTVLTLSIDRIDTEKRLDEKVWARLKKATITLRSMIDSVRFMHAVDTGRASLHLHPVNLQKAVNESLEQMREGFLVKGLTVVNEIPEEDIYIRADEATLVHNVLPNVLSNAIKFSRPGGSIWVKAQKQQNELHLIIADEGVGIPEETLRNFFDHGRLLSRQGTDGESGSGLGMLQVKTFMELYRGRMDVQSKSIEEEDESGTTVTLVFRLATKTENKNA